MKVKKTITIFVFFLLLSCGYEPLYSKKNLDTNYDFTINSITFSGKNIVNQVIKNNLKSYLNNDSKPIKLDLVMHSSISKNITSKNKKGDPEAFSLKVTINFKALKANTIKKEITLEESFEYKNKSNKFELSKYEKNIQRNLSSNLSDDIIRQLYSIK